MSRPGSHSCCCSGLEVPPRWSQTCLLMLRRQRDVMDTVGTVAVLYGRDADQTPKARIITNSRRRSDEAISPPRCLPELCCRCWGNIWQKIPPSTASHSLEPPGSQCGSVWRWRPAPQHTKKHQTLIVKVRLVQRVLRFWQKVKRNKNLQRVLGDRNKCNTQSINLEAFLVVHFH